MRHGGEKRGNSTDRRNRKIWLLSRGSGTIIDGAWHLFGGTGHTVPCFHCDELLTFQTVEADRIEPGGSYARTNIVPSCRGCNLERGDGPIRRREVVTA